MMQDNSKINKITAKHFTARRKTFSHLHYRQTRNKNIILIVYLFL